MSDDLIKIIHEYVKEIKKDISEIKVIAGKQQVGLDLHIKRSDLLEELVQHLDEQKIQPLQDSVSQIKGIYKFVMFLSLLATIALVFVEYFKH